MIEGLDDMVKSAQKGMDEAIKSLPIEAQAMLNKLKQDMLKVANDESLTTEQKNSIIREMEQNKIKDVSKSNK